MGTKRDRQRVILEVIRARRIDSQQELARALANRGVQVSQSTLSRDIRELGLAKAGNVYTPPQAGNRRRAGETLRLVLREFVTGVDSVNEILVLKTARGSAAPVAEALDGVRWPEVAATLAGDDTIFVLCRSPQAVDTLRTRIAALLTP